MDKMNYVSWEQEYYIGVEKIDHQHKELLNFINYTILYCARNKESEKKILDRIIENGKKMILEHFATEEAIMEKTKYPQYHEHKNIHEKLIKTLAEKIKGMKNGNAEFIIIEMAEYLRTWMLEHILGYDKDASEYFKKGMIIEEES